MAYQSGDTLAVVRMTAASGLLEDETVNTFAFRRTTVPAEAQFLTLAQAIDDFYNLAHSTFAKIAHFIGEGVTRSATHFIDFYKIQDGPLGSPIWTQPWLGPNAPGTANSNIPNECAACLSFHADMTGVMEESGASRPRARRRGRVYLGPLTTDAISTTDDAPRLVTGFRNAMGAAGVELMDQGDTTGWLWGVWSREDSEVRPVVGGWTDNAIDTMRKRGPASLSRTTWG